MDENGNDVLARMLGVAIKRSTAGAGSFKGNINPTVVARILPKRPKGEEGFGEEEVSTYARAV